MSPFSRMAGGVSDVTRINRWAILQLNGCPVQGNRGRESAPTALGSLETVKSTAPGESMNHTMNKIMKLACETGAKFEKQVSQVDPRTLLSKYGKYVGGGLLGLMVLSLLASGGSSGDGEAGASGTSGATSGSGPIDSRIVGRWRHTWAQADPVSGFSMAVDDWLILNADGTCEVGSGRAAGGTADVGLDSGPSQLERGVWRAEDKTLYIGDGNGQWSRVGTYICDETRLLIKAGSNTIYERQ
jgi:hypothetical protein